MAIQAEIEDVYSLIAADKYRAAATLIQSLRSKGCEHCDLLLYEAICAYEGSDDINSLRLLTDFLQQARKHAKRQYAAFTACVCLINLGLHDEALKLLQLLPSSYPDRDTEIARVRHTIDQNRAASKHAAAICALLSNA